MDINEYQKLAMRTLNPKIEKKELILNASMGLCGESGEVIDLVKKHLFQGHDLDEKVLIKQNIKDREIQMYKKYRRDMYTDPVIDSNNLRMKKMLKKIDRKIDERLTSAIK